VAWSQRGFHRGRLFDHVHLRVHDLEWSRRFYQAALGALGREVSIGEGYFSSDELWVSADGPSTERLHVPSRAGELARSTSTT
jgi:catechol 2,3-dioxygenase-like lactoylglutathione lyase family enzyme